MCTYQASQNDFGDPEQVQDTVLPLEVNFS